MRCSVILCSTVLRAVHWVLDFAGLIYLYCRVCCCVEPQTEPYFTCTVQYQSTRWWASLFQKNCDSIPKPKDKSSIDRLLLGIGQCWIYPWVWGHPIQVGWTGSHFQTDCMLKKQLLLLKHYSNTILLSKSTLAWRRFCACTVSLKFLRLSPQTRHNLETTSGFSLLQGLQRSRCQALPNVDLT